MPSSIPLIRAAIAAPIAHGLRGADRYDPEMFIQSGLPPVHATNPLRLVAFHAYLTLLARVSESEGPDFPCRTATPEGLMMLGIPSSAVLASRTVREALFKVAQTFHLHASHVFFLVQNVPGGVEITESFPVSSGPKALHAGHQQVAALVSALGRIIDGTPLPARIKLSPHPELGVDYLKQHLGPDVEACEIRQLSMFVPESALDLPLPWSPVPFAASAPSLAAAASASLSESARLLIEGMLRDGNASLDKLALAAGQSRRTMQRMLAAEGTSFAALVDVVRREMALAELTGTKQRVSEIADMIGYSNTSSLTRAVRRWADVSPRHLRNSVSA